MSSHCVGIIAAAIRARGIPRQKIRNMFVGNEVCNNRHFLIVPTRPVKIRIMAAFLRDI